MPRLLLIALLLTTALAAAGGCASGGGANDDDSLKGRGMAPRTRELRPIDPMALRGELRAGLDRWFSQVSALTSEITAQTQDRAVREAALRLRIRTATAFRFLGAQVDPRTGYLLAWIMTVQFRQAHSEGGSSATLFGDQQQRVLDAANDAEEAVLALGRRYFPPEQIDAAKPEIEEIARRAGLSERFVADRIPMTSVVAIVPHAGAVSRLLSAPLTPLTSLQGVADTPQAITNVAVAVSEFGQVMREMPEVTRWHMELLMYEANDLPVIVDARRDFERLSTAFQTLAARVDTLPEELRKELKLLLSESDASQAKLQDTLREARETIESLSVALGQADALTQNVGATATQVRTWLDERRERSEAAEAARRERGEEVGPGTSVADVTQMMERIDAAATRVRELAAQLKQPLPEDSAWSMALTQAQNRTQASITAAGDRIDDAVNKATWRAAALIGLAFVAALAYHFITRRGRGNAQGAKP